ncbi:hypothetical protein QQ045_016087 [Rhodiola kirilowii]
MYIWFGGLYSGACRRLLGRLLGDGGWFPPLVGAGLVSTTVSCLGGRGAEGRGGLRLLWRRRSFLGGLWLLSALGIPPASSPRSGVAGWSMGGVGSAWLGWRKIVERR